MSVSWVHKISGGQVKKQKNGVKTGRIIRQVLTTSATLDTPETVLNAVDPATSMAVAQIGDAISVLNPGVLCIAVDVQQHESDPLFYTVIEDYSTEEPIDPDESPLDEIPDVQWDTNESTEPIYQDRFGNPIQNSAGIRFDPQPEDEIYDQRITFSMNVATWDAELAEDAIGHVNEFAFLIDGYIILPRKALLKRYARSGLKVKNGVSYYVLSGEILTRKDTWDRSFVDQGRVELVGGQHRPIISDTNVPIQDDVKLDGNGLRLPDGDPTVYMTFETKPIFDFGDLDLP